MNSPSRKHLVSREVSQIKITATNGNNLGEFDKSAKEYLGSILNYCIQQAEDTTMPKDQRDDYESLIQILINQEIKLKIGERQFRNGTQKVAWIDQVATSRLSKSSNAIVIVLRSISKRAMCMTFTLGFSQSTDSRSYDFLQTVMKDVDAGLSPKIKASSVIVHTADNISTIVSPHPGDEGVAAVNDNSYSTAVITGSEDIVVVADELAPIVPDTSEIPQLSPTESIVPVKQTSKQVLKNSNEISQLPEDAFRKILGAMMQNHMLETIDVEKRLYFLPATSMDAIVTQGSIYDLPKDLITESRIIEELPKAFIHGAGFFRTKLRVNTTQFSEKRSSDQFDQKIADLLDALMVGEERITMIKNDRIKFITYDVGDLSAVRDLMKGSDDKASILAFYKKVNAGSTRATRSLIKGYLFQLPVSMGSIAEIQSMGSIVSLSENETEKVIGEKITTLRANISQIDANIEDATKNKNTISEKIEKLSNDLAEMNTTLGNTNPKEIRMQVLSRMRDVLKLDPSLENNSLGSIGEILDTKIVGLQEIAGMIVDQAVSEDDYRTAQMRKTIAQEELDMLSGDSAIVDESIENLIEQKTQLEDALDALRQLLQDKIDKLSALLQK